MCRPHAEFMLKNLVAPSCISYNHKQSYLTSNTRTGSTTNSPNALSVNLPDIMLASDSLELTYDEFLKKTGGFGCYQKRFFWFIAVPAVFYGSLNSFTMIYIGSRPEFACDFVHHYREDFGMNATFNETEALEKLQYFDPNSTYPSVCLVNDLPKASTAGGDETSQKPCKHAFDKSDWDENVVSQFDLVCQNDHVITLVYAAQSIGGAVGSIATAVVQDNLGRKITFTVGVATSITFGTCYVFATSWPALAILAGIKGTVSTTFFALPWIMTVEVISEQYHAFAMLVVSVAYAFGVVVLTGVCYWFTHWRHVVLFNNLIGLVFFGLFFILDESPRWLLSKGKVNKANTVLEKMALRNLGWTSLGDTVVTLEADTAIRSPLAVLSTPPLFFKTMILSWISTVCFSLYLGLSINAENLGGNLYLTFVMITIVQIPAAIMAKGSDYCGRVFLTAWSLLLCGGAAIGTAYVIKLEYSSSVEVVIVILLAAVTKLAVTTAFNVITLSIGELYPTCVRGIGFSVVSILPSVSCVATPYIVYLAATDPKLPMTVFGIMGLSAGLVTFFLPETLGRNLTDTLEQEHELAIGFKALLDNLTLASLKQAWMHSRRRREEEKDIEL